MKAIKFLHYFISFNSIMFLFVGLQTPGLFEEQTNFSLYVALHFECLKGSHLIDEWTGDLIDWL